MPDLKPVFVELRRRMSLHEDVFRRSVNSTDANGRGARKATDPEPETSYLLYELSAITAKGREMYVAQGWLASWPMGQPRRSETSDGSAAGG